MNEKITLIKNELMEHKCVSLAKQCKQEYIVYTFNTNVKRENIIRFYKDHYSDKNLTKLKKNKKKLTKIPIQKFLDIVVFDLLNRGYELETWED